MREELEVLGPRIKVRVDPPQPERSTGGIWLDTDIKNAEDVEIGTVVQLGKYAYGNFDENWCNVGDKVLFHRYTGKPKEELDSSGSMKYFRILKDIDVIARYKKLEV